MCGIAGMVNFDGKPVDGQTLQKMTDLLSHRGPDGEGMWMDPTKRVGLGHRRLAILDLSAEGSQPMHLSDAYTITYNGEIYNYLELKTTLIAKGHTFRSSSDTEVILASYHEYGTDCLAMFDGMFSFALWDNTKELLFCARDRFGEKPFYYQLNSTQFLFASEIKSLFAAGGKQGVNNNMLFNYLVYDAIENPNNKRETFYQNTFKLEASHYLIVKPGGELVIKNYWQVDYTNINHTISREDAAGILKEKLQTSVERRLRSDVSVGSSLSGGIDSSAIVSLINNQHTPGLQKANKTFSARFKDKALDEGKYIEEMRKMYDLNACYTWPSASNMYEHLDNIFLHQEEPFVSTSIIAQWEVMKLAKEENTVVLLDGQGADELLGGYGFEKHFHVYFKELFTNDKAGFKKEKLAYEKLHNRKFEMDARFYLHTLFPNATKSIGKIRRKFTVPSYFNHINPEFLSEYRDNPPPYDIFSDLNTSLHYDTFSYGLENLLRYSDRNAMAFSREIRLPFLFHELVEFVCTLPASFKINQGWTKKVLRDAMRDLVPPTILERKDKLGFRAPQSEWLKTEQGKDLLHTATSLLRLNGFVNKEINRDKHWNYIMAYQLIKS